MSEIDEAKQQVLKMKLARIVELRAFLSPDYDFPKLDEIITRLEWRQATKRPK
jgi:hypothetical protein